MDGVLPCPMLGAHWSLPCTLLEEKCFILMGLHLNYKEQSNWINMKSRNESGKRANFYPIVVSIWFEIRMKRAWRSRFPQRYASKWHESTHLTETHFSLFFCSFAVIVLLSSYWVYPTCWSTNNFHGIQ